MDKKLFTKTKYGVRYGALDYFDKVAPKFVKGIREWYKAKYDYLPKVVDNYIKDVSEDMSSYFGKRGLIIGRMWSRKTGLRVRGINKVFNKVFSAYSSAPLLESQIAYMMKISIDKAYLKYGEKLTDKQLLEYLVGSGRVRRDSFLYKARMFIRTQTYDSQRDATMLWANLVGGDLFRWRLSPGHRWENGKEICEILASKIVRYGEERRPIEWKGVGDLRGVYIGGTVPDRPHFNCRCTLEPIISEADIEWKKEFLDAGFLLDEIHPLWQRLPKKMREGIKALKAKSWDDVPGVAKGFEDRVEEIRKALEKSGLNKDLQKLIKKHKFFELDRLHLREEYEKIEDDIVDILKERFEKGIKIGDKVYYDDYIEKVRRVADKWKHEGGEWKKVYSALEPYASEFIYGETKDALAFMNAVSRSMFGDRTITLYRYVENADTPVVFDKIMGRWSLRHPGFHGRYLKKMEVPASRVIFLTDYSFSEEMEAAYYGLNTLGASVIGELRARTVAFKWWVPEELSGKVFETTPKIVMKKFKKFSREMNKVLPEDLKKLWLNMKKDLEPGAVSLDDWIKYSGVKIGEQDLMLYPMDMLKDKVTEGLKKIYKVIKGEVDGGAAAEHFPKTFIGYVQELSKKKTNWKQEFLKAGFTEDEIDPVIKSLNAKEIKRIKEFKEKSWDNVVGVPKRLEDLVGGVREELKKQGISGKWRDEVEKLGLLKVDMYDNEKLWGKIIERVIKDIKKMKKFKVLGVSFSEKDIKDMIHLSKVWKEGGEENPGAIKVIKKMQEAFNVKDVKGLSSEGKALAFMNAISRELFDDEMIDLYRFVDINRQNYAFDKVMTRWSFRSPSYGGEAEYLKKIKVPASRMFFLLDKGYLDELEVPYFGMNLYGDNVINKIRAAIVNEAGGEHYNPKNPVWKLFDMVDKDLKSSKFSYVIRIEDKKEKDLYEIVIKKGNKVVRKADVIGGYTIINDWMKAKFDKDKFIDIMLRKRLEGKIGKKDIKELLYYHIPVPSGKGIKSNSEAVIVRSFKHKEKYEIELRYRNRVYKSILISPDELIDMWKNAEFKRDNLAKEIYNKAVGGKK